MGEKKSIDGDAISSLATDIISAIRSCDNGKSMDLKVLRSAVLTTTDIDKSSKKLFKSAVKLLEKDEKVSLSSEGVVKLSKSERRDGGNSDEKKDKKRSKRKSKENEADVVDDGDDKSMKKKQRTTEEDEELNADDSQQYEQNNDDDIEQNNDGNDDDGDNDPKHKNKPCKNNPQGITRLFLGNLPFAISEPTLNTHLEECITHVKWITDKATGKFYGSAFVEVCNSKVAAKAVTQINGTMLMGRPIKINFAPVRSGEENDWPPRSRVITGGKLANAGGGGGGSGGGQAGGSGIKAMSAKPDGCCKLFIGNLSYDIDDEGITKFFMGVEAELKAVRWLYHQDSGDFKGCGYVDFWNTEACEKAATLNGKTLLGRPIRIDWAE